MAPALRKPLRLFLHIIARCAIFFCLFGLPFLWYDDLKAWIFSICPMLIFGLCYGMSSQLSHMTEKTFGAGEAVKKTLYASYVPQKRQATNPKLPEKFSKLQQNRSWAKHQIITTINFCNDSYFWTIFTGYLNYQIEHHLFPSVCSEHYPALQRIVKAHCRRYGVPYQEIHTYMNGFNQHVKLLSQCRF